VSCFIQQSCWESCDSLKSSSESHDENTGSSDDTVIAGRVLLRGSVEAQCLALTREFSKPKKLRPIAIFEETYLIVWSYLKRTSGYLRMSVKPSNTEDIWRQSRYTHGPPIVSSCADGSQIKGCQISLRPCRNGSAPWTYQRYQALCTWTLQICLGSGDACKSFDPKKK